MVTTIIRFGLLHVFDLSVTRELEKYLEVFEKAEHYLQMPLKVNKYAVHCVCACECMMVGSEGEILGLVAVFYLAGAPPK